MISKHCFLIPAQSHDDYNNQTCKQASHEPTFNVAWHKYMCVEENKALFIIIIISIIIIIIIKNKKIKNIPLFFNLFFLEDSVEEQTHKTRKVFTLKTKINWTREIIATSAESLF